VPRRPAWLSRRASRPCSAARSASHWSAQAIANPRRRVSTGILGVCGLANNPGARDVLALVNASVRIRSVSACHIAAAATAGSCSPVGAGRCAVPVTVEAAITGNIVGASVLRSRALSHEDFVRELAPHLDGPECLRDVPLQGGPSVLSRVRSHSGGRSSGVLASRSCEVERSTSHFLTRTSRAPGDVADQCTTSRLRRGRSNRADSALALSPRLSGGSVGSWRGGGKIAFGRVEDADRILSRSLLAAPRVLRARGVSSGDPCAASFPVLSLCSRTGARFLARALAMTPPSG